MVMTMNVMVCASCRDLVDIDEEPWQALRWMLSVEDGAVRRYCPACTRIDLHAVETGLVRRG
ncbi:MAG: hypothetical protein EPO13_10625 [Actinomycetota bacterium]|nr:MAG: hypothetical protein EPO13_10625 [Actinomycetota bacterium]